MWRWALIVGLFFQIGWACASESLDWAGASGHQVEELLHELGQAENLGLDPAAFNVEALRQEMSVTQPSSEIDRARFNVLFTEAYEAFARQRYYGRLDPAEFASEWVGPRRSDPALVERAHQAMRNDQVGAFLRGLDPKWGNFSALVQAKQQVREWVKQPEWSPLVISASLKPGYAGAEISWVRHRLAATQELAGAAAEGETFDEPLQEAIRQFQHKHGLEPDGILGKATVRELSATPQWRLQQIDANLERYRWLPEEWGSRYVMVNVPDFRLNVVENGNSVLQMYVVVGRGERHTPQMHDFISYVVLNPTWTVPKKIGQSDILEHIAEDPHYLKKNNFQVYKREGKREFLVDPSEVEWSKVPLHSFPYRFKQLSGTRNALGRVKFMFPNTESVYLHDTNARELFKRQSRSFSSGCVRIEKPLDLLDYLFRGDAQWTPEKLRETLQKGEETTVRLPEKVPVHLVYWTAWVDESGQLQFRHDLYDRDKLISETLQRH